MSQNFAARTGFDEQAPVCPKTAEYRLQIKLTDVGKKRLDELVELTAQESASSVVRDALRIYDLLSREVITKRGEILLREEGTGELTKLRFW